VRARIGPRYGPSGLSHPFYDRDRSTFRLDLLDVERHGENRRIVLVDQMTRLDVPRVGGTFGEYLALAGLQRLRHRARLRPLAIEGTQCEQDRVAAGEELRAVRPLVFRRVDLDDDFRRSAVCRDLQNAFLLAEDDAIARPAGAIGIPSAKRG
jgi:hypothetical protein